MIPLLRARREDSASAPAARDDGRPAPVQVETRGLSLKGRRGWVYRDVDLVAPAGRPTVIAGPAGSGRTCLLLTLAGRMRPSGGTAWVGGLELPRRARAVQRIAALGAVEGVNELESALTVGEQVGEALDLRDGLRLRLRRGDRDRHVRNALDRVGLDLPVRRFVHDLDPAEYRLLGAALALVEEPAVLLLDDVDRGLPAERQRALWERIADIADSGVTVIATCTDAGPAADLGGPGPFVLPRDKESARGAAARHLGGELPRPSGEPGQFSGEDE